MRKFDSITEGLAAMTELTRIPKKVGALLTFQNTRSKMCQTCFLFESMEDEKAQLIKMYPDSLTISNVAKTQMQAEIDQRNTVMGVVLAGVDHDFLGIQQPGHAEEFLIRGFQTACAQVSDIKFVTIYLTHSPCTVHDQKPSCFLKGFPRSCTSKFNWLAARHEKYHFTVVYWKAFGHLQGSNDSDAKDTLKALSGSRKNLAFMKL